MGALRGVLRFIDQLNDWIGKLVSFFVIPMMLILVWEVLMRYALNAPTKWAHETSEFFYGAHFILGGAYALRWGAHVKIDFLYNRLSLRRRAILDLFIWPFFFLFAGLLLWEGGQMAWIAVARMESSPSVWGPPVWPVRLTIPLGAALIILQGVTKYMTDIYIAITGRELIAAAAKKEAL